MSARNLDAHQYLGMFKKRVLRPYLWSEQVEDDSPPKEEAMVLNSTCLTLGTDDGSAESL